MIKALLRSEWIKFRSYYLALGACRILVGGPTVSVYRLGCYT